jgi:predicted GIY-YIG superfamily endonuclease
MHPSFPSEGWGPAGGRSYGEQFYVYIMASGRNGTIYIGSSNDLARRASEHREGVVEGFTKKYDCRLLVWYEVHVIWNRRRCGSCA